MTTSHSSPARLGIKRKALNGLLAVALFVGLTSAASIAASAYPAYADEDGGAQYASIAQIIVDGFGSELAPDEGASGFQEWLSGLITPKEDGTGLRETEHYVAMSTFLAYKQVVDQGETVDEFWADGEHATDAYFGQCDSQVKVYVPDVDSDYLAAFVDREFTTDGLYLVAAEYGSRKSTAFLAIQDPLCNMRPVIFIIRYRRLRLGYRQNSV